MPNPKYRTDRLLWSTEGGGIYNSTDPIIGGLSTQAQGAVPAAKLNATGVSELMDLSDFSELLIFINLTGFTGGASPSFLPEWDLADDHASGAWTLAGIDLIPLWKPGAAVTTATKWLTWLGVGQGVAPTIAGYTTAVVPVGFANLGRLAWTIANAPTTVSWSAFIYGK
jgi:hypothetical protein